MVALAPGRFSTMKFWPRSAPSWLATERASTSGPLPAAKPTRTCTGRVGYCCAWARAAVVKTAKAERTRTTRLATSMMLQPDFTEIDACAEIGFHDLRAAAGKDM